MRHKIIPKQITPSFANLMGIWTETSVSHNVLLGTDILSGLDWGARVLKSLPVPDNCIKVSHRPNLKEVLSTKFETVHLHANQE